MGRKETKATIKAVKSAKKEKVKKEVRKKRSEAAYKLSEELGVSLEEADIYLKAEEKKAKRKAKVKQVAKQGRDIFTHLQAWGERYEKAQLTPKRTVKQSKLKTQKKNAGENILNGFGFS